MRTLVTLLVAGLVLASCSPSSVERTAEVEASLKTARTFVAGSRLLKAEKAVPGRYIVVLDKKATDRGAMGLLANQLATLHGATVERTYSHALQGFAARMPEEVALRLSNDPRVRYVEEDSVVSVVGTQANATWGLDRIDQRALPLDQTYHHGFTGSGVHAYVIDTGIKTYHSEFGGRAVHGFSAFRSGSSYDCNGHGTHVAGTIGGATYGVARQVTLHAVAVMGCDGTGYTSDVIAGVDWVTANHLKPAVANMSLGGYSHESLNEAVFDSINSGVTYVVSAGNEGARACSKSPASVPTALTVGATHPDDIRASWSNYGSCVDLFAPGVNITSAGISSTDSTAVLSGTSMAAPHVTGVAALLLEGNPLASPEEISSEIITRATPDKVIAPGSGSPNLLLYSGCTGDDRTPPQVVLSTPLPGAALSGTVTLAATATDNTAVTRVAFYLDNLLIGSDATAPYALDWNSATASNGAGQLTARAYDGNCNAGVSAPVDVTIENAGNATFDPAWGAPACAAVGNKCDSVGLLQGRANVGPERHAPNTVGGSCADGLYGRYRLDPSLERLTVFRSDGTAFAAGKEVTVQATVYSDTYYTSQVLDLYAAPDANAPAWTLVASLQPAESGLQVLSATYLLPAGGPQVLRGVYRPHYDEAGVCGLGSHRDHDDLVFAAGQETDTLPPGVAISAPLEGAQVDEAVVFQVEASDNFGVQRKLPGWSSSWTPPSWGPTRRRPTP